MFRYLFELFLHENYAKMGTQDTLYELGKSRYNSKPISTTCAMVDSSDKGKSPTTQESGYNSGHLASSDSEPDKTLGSGNNKSQRALLLEELKKGHITKEHYDKQTGIIDQLRDLKKDLRNLNARVFESNGKSIHVDAAKRAQSEIDMLKWTLDQEIRSLTLSRMEREIEKMTGSYDRIMAHKK